VNGVVENIQAFCETIRTGARAETGGPEAFAVVAVLEAMVRSVAAGGSAVTVESL